MGIQSKETIASEYRTRGLCAQVESSPIATSRASLEGMISVLADKIDYAYKQAEELHNSLSSVLYPDPPAQSVGENIKQPTPVVPPAIERLEALCRRMDRLNDGLGSIQSRLCL